MEVSTGDKCRMLIFACSGCFGLAAFSAVHEVKGCAAEFGKLDLFMFSRVLHQSDSGPRPPQILGKILAFVECRKLLSGGKCGRRIVAGDVFKYLRPINGEICQGGPERSESVISKKYS